MRLLLAWLQLEATAKLPRKEPEGHRAVFDLYAFGEILPETFDRGGDTGRFPRQRNGRSRAQSFARLSIGDHAIASERTADSARFVDMIRTLPILAAARVLINFQPASLLRRRARLGRAEGARRPSLFQGKSEGKILKVDRGGIA